jgi:uncharacterized protein YneF (UPF0154 family)
MFFGKKQVDKLMKKNPAIGKMMNKEDVLALLKKEVAKQKGLKEQKRTEIE